MTPSATGSQRRRPAVRRRLTVAAVVLVTLAGLTAGLLSTTDLADDGLASAAVGPGEVTCELPRMGFVTCRRDIEKGASQRLEVSVPAAAVAVVVRANADDRSPASSRRVGPGETRILLNEGDEGTVTVQARTRLFDLSGGEVRFEVSVVDG
jgi:hypothetical protein